MTSPIKQQQPQQQQQQQQDNEDMRVTGVPPSVLSAAYHSGGGSGSSLPYCISLNGGSGNGVPPGSTTNPVASLYHQHPHRRPRPSSSSSSSQKSTTNTSTSTTSTTTTIDETDILLARELNQLSLVDRERVLEEIHGITTISYDETNDIWINDQLQQLELEIKNIKEERYYYDKAHFLCPSRIRSKSFRLMFLRSSQYQSRIAARKIVNHFNYKVELFGMDKLIHPITINDLDDNDLITLRTGAIQILNQRDSGGRSVIFFNRSRDIYQSWKNQYKVIWYSVMVALEDEYSQRHGLVSVDYHTGNISPTANHQNMGDVKETYRHIHLLRDGLPVRVAALHFCYDDIRLKPIMTVMRLFLGRELRFRFRDHCGSHVECMYRLMSFGIKNDMLPFDENDEFTTRYHLEFLERRQQEEESRRKASATATITPSSSSSSSSSLSNSNSNSSSTTTSTSTTSTSSSTFILYPNPNDVLLGRGRPFQQWNQNSRFANLITKYQMEYNESNRNDKTKLTRRIVQLVKQSPEQEDHQGGSKVEIGGGGVTTGTGTATGRFLKRDGQVDGGWIEVNDNVAREKVAHAFRYNSTPSSTTTTTTTTSNNIMSMGDGHEEQDDNGMLVDEEDGSYDAIPTGGRGKRHKG